MRFKKVALLSGLTVLAASIVVLPSSSVNRNTTTKSTTQMQVADGAPFAAAAAYGEKRVVASGRCCIASRCRPPQQCDRPNRVRVFQFGTLDAI